MKYCTLRNGDKMPALGLGTWRAEKGELQKAVLTALGLGYRHFDCAHVYGNENEVGQALAMAGINRDELWVTSKLWNNAHAPELVKPALLKTLEALQLEYLNLYLIHWPVHLVPQVMYPSKPTDFIAWKDQSILETWAALEECVEEGLVKNIGLSNFSTRKIDAISQYAKILPSVSQVELHPYMQQQHMKKYCDEHEIVLTGFAPLGSSNRPLHQTKQNEPSIFTDRTICSISSKHGVTPAQISLSWALQRGLSVIPKSTNPHRLKENLQSWMIVLSTEEMDELTTLEQKYRFFDGSHWMQDGTPYSMENLWDGE